MVQRHVENLMDQNGILCQRNGSKTITTDSLLIQSLTDRERQILHSLSKGKSRIECAEEFCLSEATISTHIKNIYRKLGVKNRVEATRVAMVLPE